MRQTRLSEGARTADATWSGIPREPRARAVGDAGHVDFTLGGTLGANAHGWQHDEPPALENLPTSTPCSDTIERSDECDPPPN